MLSGDERYVLVTFCFNHQVATCRTCWRDLKLAETGGDTEERWRYHHCPSCRADLTDSIRLHVLTCKAISLALGERVDQARIRIKQSQALNAASELLAAESEERAQRVWRRRTSHPR